MNEPLPKQLPPMSEEAKAAMADLLAGRPCMPSEAVAAELGRIGLAYRAGRAWGRTKRLTLTKEGAKYLP